MRQKLLELLNQYIDEYKKIKEEYNHKRTNVTLYQELINILNDGDIEENKMLVTILLTTIYKNNIYVDEFYGILLKPERKQELKRFNTKILNDYNTLKLEVSQLKNRLDRNDEIVSSAYRARKSFSLQTKILDSKNDIYNIKKIVNYYSISGVISNKEEILLINEIELHNRKTASKYGTKEEQEYTEYLYNELPNVLNIGFQELDEIEVLPERKKTLDSFAKEINNLIPAIDKEQIIELLETYRKYNLEDREYNYIIIKLLNEYLDEMLILYTFLLDKEVYSKRSQRIELIKDYYSLLERYIIIINYYNNITEYTLDIPEEQEEPEIIKQEERKLIYSRSIHDITQAKIISDMGTFPYENYENIENLIIQFKDGTLGNKKIKTIKKGNKSDGHIELKNDNIRIVLRRVQDNIYCVLGVFIKKANNDSNAYRTITNRMTPDVSTDDKLYTQLELAKHTEEELKKIVKEKSRKNGR